jgi:spore germination protein GerM
VAARITRWIGALAVLAIASCGIPVDSRPRDIPVLQAVTTLPRLSVQDPQARAVKLYFVASATGRTDRLQPVLRRADADPAAVVRELLKGLSTSDDRTLRTAIPPDTKLRAASVNQEGTALIDLDQTFFKAKGDQLVRALAQLVFSVSALDGVGQVHIVVDGTPREWPLGDGIRQTRALTVADFAELNPTSQPDYVLLPSPPVGTTAK